MAARNDSRARNGLAGVKMLTRTLPSFAALPLEQQTVEALRAMFDDPPVVQMELADLEQEVREIRGVYECSQPDLAGELSLKYSRRYTQWLTREPDWRRARTGRALYLREMTPVLFERDGKEFYQHAIWRIEVIGETAQRLQAAADAAMMRRARAA